MPAVKTQSLQLERCDGVGKRQCPECREWLYADDFSNDLHPLISDAVDMCVDCRAHAFSDMDAFERTDRRRAFHFGVAYERVDRLRVFERDNWACSLCGRGVDSSLPPRDDWGPTIDHVVPISQGGPHTFDNLRLAHRSCNTARGTGEA